MEVRKNKNMNKEEIEEIETLEIDFKDTDELELALEVSSKKAIYLIDDLIKHLFELQQENQKYKEVIDKVSSQIKLYGKYNGEKCTRGFSMMPADFNKLVEIIKEVK